MFSLLFKELTFIFYWSKLNGCIVIMATVREVMEVVTVRSSGQLTLTSQLHKVTMRGKGAVNRAGSTVPDIFLHPWYRSNIQL